MRVSHIGDLAPSRLWAGLIVMGLVMFAMGPAAADEARRPPNVVLVVTDDQGYGDVGVYEARGITTPHLDRLASEGLYFTQFYVAEATCSASRAALLTGCYAKRLSMPEALTPHALVGLNPAETTMAEMLKAHGYATAAVGKWHLGHLPCFLPTRQGFDEYLGLPYSNDMWPVGYDGRRAETGRKSHYPELPLLEGEEKVAEIRTQADQDDLTRRYTERALSFIRRNKGRPFFLYLAHSMPHVPLGVSDRFRGKSEQGLYGDVILEIDDSIGQIVAALDEHGIAENTLLIFVSDNGPWLNFGNHGGSAGALREGKGTAWEGGARVPCLVYWPGRVAPGRVCTQLAATIDLLPTIAELTGAERPAGAIDGVSLASILVGRTKEAPRDHFAYYYGGGLRAIRDARYKLVFPHVSRSYVGVDPGRDGIPGPYAKWEGGPLLFDLLDDPGETTDILAAHPDVAQRLEALAEEVRAALGDALTQRKGAEVRPIGRMGRPGQRRVGHHAVGKPLALRSSPSEPHSGGSPDALVDGLCASHDYEDDAWQGFSRDDLEAVIDLEEPRALDHLALTFLESQTAGVFLPVAMEVAISIDGKAFEVVDHRTLATPQSRVVTQVKAYRFDLAKRRARYVRIRAENIASCPDWHQRRGEDAWLFADEIVVR